MLGCRMHINADLMSSAEASQVHFPNHRKTDNYRLHNRFIICFHCLIAEHAKVLLPQIIPTVVPERGSKILLLLLFFGANDATLKGAAQHVSSQSNFLTQGPIRHIRLQSRRTTHITSPHTTQSKNQTPSTYTTTNLRIPLW